MATHKFILWKQFTDKDGKHPIRLVVRKDNATKYITTSLTAADEQWNEKECRYKTNEDIRKEYSGDVPLSKCSKEIRDSYNKEISALDPEREKHNEYLTRKKAEIVDIIRLFEKERINWTLSQFDEKYRNTAKQGLVIPFFERHIAELRSTGNTGNANCYQRTLDMLLIYDKRLKSKTFADINLAFVRGFDRWMQKPRKTEYKSAKGNVRIVEREGCKGNTRKYYLKALRAVLNLAIAYKEATKENYPFGKGLFEIAELEEETTKRYLSDSDLAKIKETDLTKHNKTNDNIDLGMEEVRRIFLFLYHSYGMSYVDAAHLKKSNIVTKDGELFIIYRREKLKRAKKAKHIEIRILPSIQELLDWFSENSLLIGDYLIPIVTKENITDEELYNHIRNRYKVIKTNLAKMEKVLELESQHLTSYVSRHSFAMRLQQNKIPREVISQAMGHSNLKTTQTYLDSFSSKDMGDLGELL